MPRNTRVRFLRMRRFMRALVRRVIEQDDGVANARNQAAVQGAPTVPPAVHHCACCRSANDGNESSTRLYDELVARGEAQE